MKCKECNTDNVAGANFCHICGASLKTETLDTPANNLEEAVYNAACQEMCKAKKELDFLLKSEERAENALYFNEERGLQTTRDKPNLYVLHIKFDMLVKAFGYISYYRNSIQGTEECRKLYQQCVWALNKHCFYCGHDLSFGGKCNHCNSPQPYVTEQEIKSASVSSDIFNMLIERDFMPDLLTGYKIQDKQIETVGMSAVIKKVWQERFVCVGGQKGMKIHVKFSTRSSNYLNTKGTCFVYFYFGDGTPLKDCNNSYRTTDGNVAVSEDFILTYDYSSFEDFVLFIPYDEFHLSQGHKLNLKAYVSLWTYPSGAAKEIARSDWFHC